MTKPALIAVVEHLQDQVKALRSQVTQPHAPLSMGERAQALETIVTLAACLGNLKRALTRGDEAHG